VISTSGKISSSDKYTGNSIYGRTVGVEYPTMKRISNKSEKIQRSKNHHPHIIDKKTFDLVQKMKKKRTNIELDKYGNKVRKSTHYSMKQRDKKVEELVE
jgi:hypothetical protein